MRDENDFTRHLDYIQFNPVEHDQAIRPLDWPYSSFHRWVRLGAYPLDWAADAMCESTGFGQKCWVTRLINPSYALLRALNEGTHFILDADPSRKGGREVGLTFP